MYKNIVWINKRSKKWKKLFVTLFSHNTNRKSFCVVFFFLNFTNIMTNYSMDKWILNKTLIKRFLQVSQFGCTCFALLFDDIEPEMSESDKQIFQSFAHAQVILMYIIRILLCGERGLCQAVWSYTLNYNREIKINLLSIKVSFSPWTWSFIIV